MVTGASLLVPVVGLVTAPILSQVLGPIGRGQTGIAMAPNLLIVGGATLGLPQALTYVVATRPADTRKAFLQALGFTIALGLAAALVLLLFSNSLAVNDRDVEVLTIFGIWLAIPTLIVSLLRGVALGNQQYRLVAIDKAANSVIKLVWIVALAASGNLTVLSTFVVLATTPLVSGLVYAALCFSTWPVAEHAAEGSVSTALLRFGAQEWMGSIAVMLMARMSGLLVAPLSSVDQLGLLLVAITISDIPFLVTQALRDIVFGYNSRTNEPTTVLSTCRLATQAATVFSLAVGGSLPFWVEFLFGRGFDGSVVPSWILLAAAALSVPGLIAGAALDSLGSPGKRSRSLAMALLVNVTFLVILTPAFGAAGAAWATLLGVILSTALMVRAASVSLGVKTSSFLIPSKEDYLFLRRLVHRH